MCGKCDPTSASPFQVVSLLASQVTPGCATALAAGSRSTPRQPPLGQRPGRGRQQARPSAAASGSTLQQQQHRPTVSAALLGHRQHHVELQQARSIAPARSTHLCPATRMEPAVQLTWGRGRQPGAASNTAAAAAADAAASPCTAAAAASWRQLVGRPRCCRGPNAGDAGCRRAACQRGGGPGSFHRRDCLFWRVCHGGLGVWWRRRFRRLCWLQLWSCTPARCLLHGVSHYQRCSHQYTGSIQGLR